MIDENNCAVITSIDENFEENIEKDFLETLRKIAFYKGKIIIIDYGMSYDTKERIKLEYNVDIYTFEKTMPVFVLRNRDIPKVIDSLPQTVTNIMVIDGGDVWFQRPITPIFEKTKDKLGCVAEPEIFGQSKWLTQCLNSLSNSDSKKILEVTNGKCLKNAGMICGPRNLMIEITDAIFIDTVKTGIEFFGIDQLFFNYEFSKIKNKTVILEDEFNYVIVTHKDEFSLQNGQVFDKNLKQVTVVHNAGGNWRILKRPYGKIFEDEPQYYPDIIRPINL